MKKILVIAFCLLNSMYLKAQQLKVVDGGVQIDTISESSNSKSQLFSNGLAFISSTFIDTKAVISIKDLELGEIVFSSNILGSFDKIYPAQFDKNGKRKSEEYSKEMPLKVGFTCHLYLKDNKFKIVMKNMDYVNSLMYLNGDDRVFNFTPRMLGTDFEDHIRNVNLVKEFVVDLTTFINKKPENEF